MKYIIENCLTFRSVDRVTVLDLLNNVGTPGGHELEQVYDRPVNILTNIYLNGGGHELEQVRSAGQYINRYLPERWRSRA